jgi:flagellar basal-body rod protein FlgB
MSKPALFDDAMRITEKAISISSRRHTLISGNIANLDTVGFNPKDLDFQKTLAAEMSRNPEKLARTSERHYAFGKDIERRDVSATDPFNPDPVNIDTEMTHLVQNNIQYKTSIEMLKRKMNMLKYAITEGGR